MYHEAHKDDRRRMKESKRPSWRPNFASAQKSGHRKKGGGRGSRHGAHYEETVDEPEEEEDSPGDQEELQEEEWSEEEEEFANLPAEEDIPDLESDDLSDVDPEELMETYFQGVRAHRKLKRIGFRGKGKGKGRSKSSGKGKPLRTAREEVSAKTVDSLVIGAEIQSVPKFAQAKPNPSARKVEEGKDTDPMECSW
jgi:ATP-dependent exoDNAse (exonuclease V) beta subunit